MLVSLFNIYIIQHSEQWCVVRRASFLVRLSRVVSLFGAGDWWRASSSLKSSTSSTSFLLFPFLFLYVFPLKMSWYCLDPSSNTSWHIIIIIIIQSSSSHRQVSHHVQFHPIINQSAVTSSFRQVNNTRHLVLHSPYTAETSLLN